MVKHARYTNVEPLLKFRVCGQRNGRVVLVTFAEETSLVVERISLQSGKTCDVLKLNTSVSIFL